MEELNLKKKDHLSLIKDKYNELCTKINIDSELLSKILKERYTKVILFMIIIDIQESGDGFLESPVKKTDQNARKNKINNRNSTRLDQLSESYGVDSLGDYAKVQRESTGTIGERKQAESLISRKRPLPSLQT